MTTIRSLLQMTTLWRNDVLWHAYRGVERIKQPPTYTHNRCLFALCSVNNNSQQFIDCQSLRQAVFVKSMEATHVTDDDYQVEELERSGREKNL